MLDTPQGDRQDSHVHQLRRVIFISQRQAEAMRPPRDAALISITDPKRAQAAIPDGWHAVLRVAFDDKDPVTFPDDYEDLQEINADQVTEIAEYVATHARSCKRLVVHCRYGVSRSAAVAKGIAEATGVSFPQEYDEYNRFVYLALRRVVEFAVHQAGASPSGGAVSTTRPSHQGVDRLASTMPHLVLLGDSILDNVTYVTPGPNVLTQVRAVMPASWRVSQLAFDGSVAKDVEAQLQNLPQDASHLVISAGGNDMLQEVDLLVCPVSTATEALLLLDDAVREFEAAYRNLISLALERGLPLVLCAVYDCNFQDPQFQRCARLAIALYNDVIIRVAAENKLPAIDLRFVCCEPAHYANDIEPSVAGGERIAAAIAKAVLTAR